MQGGRFEFLDLDLEVKVFLSEGGEAAWMTIEGVVHPCSWAGAVGALCWSGRCLCHSWCGNSGHCGWDLMLVWVLVVRIVRGWDIGTWSSGDGRRGSCNPGVGPHGC